MDVKNSASTFMGRQWPLQKAPPRGGILMKLQPYNLQVTYKPEKELKIADALSRAYLEEEKEQLLDRDLEVQPTFRISAHVGREIESCQGSYFSR